MSSLFDATKRLAEFVTTLWESDATATDNNSLTDSLAAFNDQHVGGTIWMLDGTLEGTAIRVTEKTSATVLAFATQAANVTSGDRYALANGDFGLYLLRRCINRAVQEYAKRRTEDETLVTVSEQERYTLPEGVREVKEVWQAVNDAAPYDWYELHHWDEVDGELVFPTGFTPYDDDYKLRVVYRAAHEDMTDDADELPTDVNEDLIHWQAAVHAVRDGLMRFEEDPKRDLTNKMNEAQAKLEQARRNWHAWQRSVRAADY